MTTTTSPRMKLPNWAPVMGFLLESAESLKCNSLAGHLHEAASRFHQCALGRQPFHRAGAVEAVAVRAARENPARVFGRGDRATVAQHQHVRLDGARRG